MTGDDGSKGRAVDLVGALLARRALPSFADLGVAEGRRFIDERSRRAGPKLPVAEVEDLLVPTGDESGRGRPIPVRRYAAGATRGCVVHLHGGGWVFGDLETSDAQCRILAAVSGATVISVDYALAPEHPFPAALLEVLDVLWWAAGSVGGPLVISGESAGGNLAAAVALIARDLAGPALAGVVLHYPILDAAADTASYRRFGDLNYLTARDMGWFWDQYEPDPARRSGAHHSPGQAPDLAGLPPFYVVTAENDVLRDEGERFAARLVEAGGAVTFARAPGATHGFLGWTAELPGATDWLERAGRWIGARLTMDI